MLLRRAVAQITHVGRCRDWTLTWSPSARMRSNAPIQPCGGLGHEADAAAEPGMTRTASRAPKPAATVRTPHHETAASGHGCLRALCYALWKNPETSPNAKAPNWPDRQDRPSSVSPTCSKRACGMCFRSRARKRKQALTGGSWAQRRSRYSSSSPPASNATG